MADVNFEEVCPCGTSTKISGYTSEVRLQILSWRRIHNSHANAIAKAIAAAKEKQAYPQYIYQYPITTTMPYTFNTGVSSGGIGSTKKEEQTRATNPGGS